MVLKPNLVVGVVGLLVFASLGTYIATHWKDLTGTERYEVGVERGEHAFGERAGGAVSGDQVNVPYEVPDANVHQVQLRLTWDASTPIAGTRPTVTLTLRDAEGRVVARASGQGGLAGITVDESLRDVPGNGSFEATEEQADTKYADLFPTHDEDQGTWVATVQVGSPDDAPPSALSYRLSFTYGFYTTTLQMQEEVEPIK